MKRLLALVCILCLALGLAGEALAVASYDKIEVHEQVYGVPESDKKTAPLIAEGISYHQEVKNNRSLFVRFLPKYTGSYVFSYAQDRGDWMSIEGMTPDSEMAPTSFVYQLQANKEYILIARNSNHGYYAQFCFALCCPEKNIHPQNQIYTKTQNASCAEPAKEASYCQYCGMVVEERETEPALGHTPGEWKVEKQPSCPAEGLYARRCTVCDEIIESQALPVTKHVPGEEETLTPATCLIAGQAGVKCVQCGTVLTSSELPILPHKAGAWTDVVPPTCTDVSIRYQYCTDCGLALNVENGHALGHIPVYKEVPASCMTLGKRTGVCSVCNMTLSTEELPMTEHQPAAWMELKTATCTEPGLRVQRCKICGESLNTENVPALGHASATNENAPSCISTGKKNTVCTICNEVLTTETLPITAHTPVWETELAARCTAEGIHNQVCSVCHEVLATEAIPAHGHSPMEWEVAKDSACLQAGQKVQRCAVCQSTLQSEEIPALAHAWTDWVTDLEATKEHGGRMSRFCTHCGKEEIETIPQLEKILGIF